jgi:hypothetical protein
MIAAINAPLIALYKDENTLQNHRCENLKSYMKILP